MAKVPGLGWTPVILLVATLVTHNAGSTSHAVHTGVVASVPEVCTSWEVAAQCTLPSPPTAPSQFTPVAQFPAFYNRDPVFPSALRTLPHTGQMEGGAGPFF